MPRSTAGKNLWEEEVRALFQAPEVEPLTPGIVSTVHLLRREVIESLIDLGSFGAAMVSEDFAGNVARSTPRRLFASTMVICTGIDLLATLSYGDAGAIGKRFQKVLLKSVPSRLGVLEARRVWGLRNGLMHSFSVRSHTAGVRGRGPSKGRKASRRKSATGTRARLTTVKIALLGQPLDGTVARRVNATDWIVSVPELYDAFREVVAATEARLRDLPGRERRRARTMIRRYGQLQVGLLASRKRASSQARR